MSLQQLGKPLCTFLEVVDLLIFVPMFFFLGGGGGGEAVKDGDDSELFDLPLDFTVSI